jgi:alkanesulfonate monooxygenase SsuD/methylene tetrahydromethanopterin reductase-like flavin-dependent oxidoreductase (luciferase family)
VHDIVNLEGLGVPSVFVASTEFVEAADAQSRALGADPARVFVPHPIQDRTDDELRALADDAIEAILQAITTTDAGVT